MSASGPDLDSSPSTEPAADDTTGPPSDARGQNINALAIFTLARREADKSAKDVTSGARSLYAALTHPLALYEYSNKNETNFQEVKSLCKEKKIRIIYSTGKFTPLVKLVFPIEQPSNIHRYASVLKLARGEGIKSEDLTDFIDKTGGIVKCVAAELKQRKAANPSLDFSNKRSAPGLRI